MPEVVIAEKPLSRQNDYHACPSDDSPRERGSDDEGCEMFGLHRSGRLGAARAVATNCNRLRVLGCAVPL